MRKENGTVGDGEIPEMAISMAEMKETIKKLAPDAVFP